MITTDDLVKVTNFETLVKVLRDQLDWPIPEDYEFGDVTYEYEAKELGLKPDQIAKIREVHQLRPLTTNQPWGIFFVSFEDKGIPVTVMRRILRSLVLTKRADAKDANRAAWQRNDLLFISAHGKGGARELSFAHFADGKETGDLPVLRVLNWNRDDTVSHNQYVTEMLNKRLHWPDDPNNLAAWRAAWASAFEIGYQETIRTARDMSVSLAALACQIRKRANELLVAESESGSMRHLHKAFRENLIRDLSEDDFADMFAQTISYGLLAARISRPAGLVVDNLADMIPPTNPFLKELFESFLKLGGRDKRKDVDFDELGVRDVVDMLNRANMPAVLRDFGDRNPKEDPVLHFYELFLKEYDPKKRMQRGVFYTPRPVVNFIVRGVDEILRTEFGLPLGLADTSTWAEIAARNNRISIPANVRPDAPFVQILDPATGTGTFLVEVIDLIHKRMEKHWKGQGKSTAEVKAAWNAYVPAHLLPRLTAFELMMAPYTIAHMKVGLKLSETGYTFVPNERAHIFLTNALEPARDLDMEFIFMAEALAHEAQAANDAKAKSPFTVVIGNPPYAGISKNMFPWIDGLLKGREPEPRLRKSYYEVDGVPLGEKKIWLQDDYVKFIRLAQYFLDRSGQGILGFISNNGYLDNPTFRGMRWQLMQSFNRISLLDLHGSTKKKETASGGDVDQNVFDIEQGVGIGFFVNAGERARVSLEHFFGSRESKADTLLSRGLVSATELELDPVAPFYFFHDRDETHGDEYRSNPKITEVLSVSVTGIVTARDDLAISLDESGIERTIAELCDSSISDGAIRAAHWPGKKHEKYAPGDSRGWKLPAARAALRKIGDPASKIQPCVYRPFDIRKIFYDPALVDWGRWDLMPHMIGGDNVGIVTTRQCKDNWDAKAASTLIGHKALNDYDINSLFPLWLKPSAGDTHRRPNIDRKFAQVFGAAVGLTYEDGIPGGKQGSLGPEFRSEKPQQMSLDAALWDGRGDLKKSFGPRDLFNYIYAVLHSLSYRDRYAEFLRSDFPRIPVPRGRAMFAELASRGCDLIALHLLRPGEASILERPEIRIAGSGDTRVEKGYPEYKNGKVMINASRWFEDVPRATWEFYVGGYQVCEKWLKDRAGKGGRNPSPGRVLTDDDLLHYRRVVVALTETRRLMAEIDRVIDQHGGWPDAFARATEEAN